MLGAHEPHMHLVFTLLVFSFLVFTLLVFTLVNVTHELSLHGYVFM